LLDTWLRQRPNAQPHEQPLAGALERLGQRRADAFGDLDRVPLAGERLAENDELVASQASERVSIDPGHGVAFPQNVLEAAGQLH
jgi:hypothetical protein